MKTKTENTSSISEIMLSKTAVVCYSITLILIVIIQIYGMKAV